MSPELFRAPKAERAELSGEQHTEDVRDTQLVPVPTTAATGPRCSVRFSGRWAWTVRSRSRRISGGVFERDPPRTMPLGISSASSSSKVQTDPFTVKQTLRSPSFYCHMYRIF